MEKTSKTGRKPVYDMCGTAKKPKKKHSFPYDPFAFGEGEENSPGMATAENYAKVTTAAAAKTSLSTNKASAGKPSASGKAVSFNSRSNNDPDSDNEFNFDFNNEVSKMLENFNSDINKSFATKKKRLDHYTATVKGKHSQVEEAWNAHSTERQKFHDEHMRKMTAGLDQWDSHLQKSKEQYEKLSKTLQQYQKTLVQSQASEAEHVNLLRQHQEAYMAGMKEMEQKHQEQQNLMTTGLKKEISSLHKRVFTEIQQREMTNVRKNLQSMLFTN